MTATKRKPRPITANPLFPLVTALWAATFLGLGSFAVAPALLEGPVVALGIPALVPAATPPLGFTARVMFAIAMMGIGAIAGYAIGRLMGREKVEAPVRMRGFGKAAREESTFETCRPINAAEDLGAPLDALVAEEVPLRRRALNLDSSLESPADAMPWDLEPAPQPASEFVSTRYDVSPDVALDTTMADPLALDLLLEEAGAVDHVPFDAPHAAVAESETAEEPEAQWAEVQATDFAQEPGPVDQPSAVPAFVPAAAPFLQAQAAAATPISRAPLDNLGLVQLIERLALAIARRAEGVTELGAEVGAGVGTGVGERPARADFTITAPAPQATIARFESSPFAQPEGDGNEALSAFDGDHPERVVQLRPSTSPSILPLAHPFADPASVSDAEENDEGEEEDLGLDRFLRMSPLLARKRPAATPAADDFDADVFDPESIADSETPEPEIVEDRYPSLLDMGSVVARREPLRIGEEAFEDVDADEASGIEPVVIFPGQESPLASGPSVSAAASAGTSRPFERPSIMPLPGSPLASRGRAAPSPQTLSDDGVEMATSPAVLPDAEEADRALRAALATLQRMTAQG